MKAIGNASGYASRSVINSAKTLKSAAANVSNKLGDIAGKRYEPNARPYGSTSMLLFLCCVMSRLAYDSEKFFITRWARIFDCETSCLPKSLFPSMHTFLSGKPDNVKLSALFNSRDNEIFTDANVFPVSKSTGGITDDDEGTVEFKEWARQVNIITSEARIDANTSNCKDVIYTERPANLVMTSVSTSNYGTVYIVADKRAPCLIWVIFRGTYNKKTADSYLRVSTVRPIDVKGHGYLEGMAKILIECTHAIVSSMMYVSELVKDVNSPAKMSVICTGHSLGACLSTIFTDIYANLTQVPPMFNSQIGCVSVASSRILSVDTATKFCNNKNILYRRLTNTNDPTTGVPPKALGYAHPCSDSEDTRSKVLVECIVPVTNSNSHRCPVISASSGRLLSMTADVNLPFACEKTADRIKTRKGPILGGVLGLQITMMQYHAIYLGVLYAGALKITENLNNPVDRFGKNTLLRLVKYTSDAPNVVSVCFVDLTLQRLPIHDNVILKSIQEDVFNTPAFIKNCLNGPCLKSEIDDKNHLTPKNSTTLVEHNTDQDPFWLKWNSSTQTDNIGLRNTETNWANIQQQLNQHTSENPIAFNDLPIAIKNLLGGFKRTRNRRNLRRRKTFRKQNYKFYA